MTTHRFNVVVRIPDHDRGRVRCRGVIEAILERAFAPYLFSGITWELTPAKPRRPIKLATSRKDRTAT